jgi:GNAT superfamily N-acetyltransferase
VTRDLSALPEGFTFAVRRVDHPDAAELLRAFYDEQVGRYGFAESIDLDPIEYTPPQGIFVVVYEGNRPVGCGSCRWYDTSSRTAEIKKTYLVPEVRRRGVGRALLAWLEAQASGWGAQRVLLETGVRNAAALRLFAGSGYRPTARYVAGRDPEINRAFVKSLTRLSQPRSPDAERANVR